jgi:outer membrane protein OmpA-like peptidoglycan-associated protein
MHERTSISNGLVLKSASTSTASIRTSSAQHRVRRFEMTLLGVFSLGIVAITPIALMSTASAVVAPKGTTTTKFSAHDSTTYSVGTPNTSEPSGVAPPTTSEIPGYQLSYVTGFGGSSLPAGWFKYSGKPSGDASGQWAPSHVVVSNNMLQLNTFEDPQFSNAWVEGGVSKSSAPHTYGAYFVRSRTTGAGPTQVELLWPTNGWPPEMDFNETYGGVTATQATLHYTSANLQIHTDLTIDMTAWHTWGVIWTPTSVTYTVDGSVWGTVTDAAAIPDQPMSLNLQQQIWCSSGFACPTTPESMDINWVAEYVTGATSPSTTTTTTSNTTTSTLPTPASTSPDPIMLGSFTKSSVGLSSHVKVGIRHLAKVIAKRGDSTVTLTGYSNGVANQRRALVLSKERASKVKMYLEEQLASLNDHGVTIVVIGAGDSFTSTTSVNARVDSGRVVALLR